MMQQFTEGISKIYSDLGERDESGIKSNPITDQYPHHPEPQPYLKPAEEKLYNIMKEELREFTEHWLKANPIDMERFAEDESYKRDIFEQIVLEYKEVHNYQLQPPFWAIIEDWFWWFVQTILLSLLSASSKENNMKTFEDSVSHWVDKVKTIEEGELDFHKLRTNRLEEIIYDQLTGLESEIETGEYSQQNIVDTVMKQLRPELGNEPSVDIGVKVEEMVEEFFSTIPTVQDFPPDRRGRDQGYSSSPTETATEKGTGFSDDFLLSKIRTRANNIVNMSERYLPPHTSPEEGVNDLIKQFREIVALIDRQDPSN